MSTTPFSEPLFPPVGFNDSLPVPAGEQPAYRSGFERVLSLGRTILLILLALWAGLFYLCFDDAATIARTLRQDAASSIVAAKSIKTHLASARAQFAAALLARDGDPAPFVAGYANDLRDVQDAALSIAENAGSSRTIHGFLRDLLDYQSLVDKATAKGSDDPLRQALAAEDWMRARLFSPPASLDQYYYEHLTRNWVAHRDAQSWLFSGAALASVLLVAGMGIYQLLIFRFSGRTFNVPLLSAACVVAVFSAAALFELERAQSGIEFAAQPNSKSIRNLWEAKAVAADADGAKNFLLLLRDDRAAAQRYANAFAEDAMGLARLAPREVEAVAYALTDLSGRKKRVSQSPGLIDAALANAGERPDEREAMMSARNNWLNYMKIYSSMRVLAATNHAAEAVALNLGNAPEQASGAFARFEQSLDQALRIDQKAFDDAIADAESRGGWFAYFATAGAWLTASVLTWLGAWARLREYRP